MFMDIVSTILCAGVLLEIYTELPKVDHDGMRRHVVGRPRKAQDGTRDAPVVWREELAMSLQRVACYLESSTSGTVHTC